MNATLPTARHVNAPAGRRLMGRSPPFVIVIVGGAGAIVPRPASRVDTAGIAPLLAEEGPLVTARERLGL